MVIIFCDRIFQGRFAKISFGSGCCLVPAGGVQLDFGRLPYRTLIESFGNGIGWISGGG
jgi:hypothetical protein